MIFGFQGCCAINTPFNLSGVSPVPVSESYISLQSEGSLIRVFGSAVVIEDGWGVTNRHVVEKIGGMLGYVADGRRFFVQNAILSERLDLAFFKIPHGVGKPMTRGAKAQNGDRIFSAGTTCSDTLLNGTVVASVFKFHHINIKLREASQGKIKGRSVTQGFVYEGNFIKGFSGGPVVNTKGELVGINQGQLLQVLSGYEIQPYKPEKVYGLAYHLEDVLIEFDNLAGRFY